MKFIVANWMNIIGVISFALGIVALVISYVQNKQSNLQTQRLKEHSDSLGLIADSLSTRYIGQFPDYMSSVTKLIEGTKTGLTIFKSNPIPAFFTLPTEWISYSQAIERKIHSGINVDIITINEKQRRIRLIQQFPGTKDEWENWALENRSRLVHFLKFEHPKIKLEELDHDKFIDLLVFDQNRKLNECFKSKGIEVSEIDQTMPIQVWIADGKQAVFTIQTLLKNSANHAFFTNDIRIVSALQLMTELFAHQKTNFMSIHSRIDTVIVTKDLNRSISLYRDEIGLEMLHLSNPVGIFKYDYISIYVYQHEFFKEQFKIGSEEISGNGMLSIEIKSKEVFDRLKSKLSSAKSDNYTVLSNSTYKIIIRDFNNLVIDLWINFQMLN